MKSTLSSLLAIAATVLAAGPALAHHPLGGMPMETFGHGVLSGIGHPVLGFDHLFFVIMVGIAAVYTGRAALAPAGYIAAMLLGCLLSSFGAGLPLAEIAIGLSLLVVGGVVLSGRALGLTSAMVLFAAFGLFHGSAFGGSIAEQEAAVGLAVLVGYLIGLGAVQYAIAVGAGWLAQQLWSASDATAVNTRLAGAVVAGVGLFLTLESAEGVLFDLMGWAV